MPDDKQLVTVEAQPLARVESETASLIRVALEKGLNPTELYAILREERAAVAKAAFITAKAAFKGQCPEIRRSEPSGQFTRVDSAGVKRPYCFAPLDQMQTIADPHLKANGFSYDWTEEKGEGDEVYFVFVLSHTGGHSERHRVKLVAPDKGGFSPPQGHGIARAYARRQSYQDGLGLRIVGEDQDGNTGTPELITVEQMQTLNDLLIELAEARGTTVEVVRPGFCKAQSVDQVGDIPAAQYAKAAQQIEQGIARARKEASK